MAIAKPNNAAVYIPADIYAKIMYWMELAAPDECSGMGSIIWDKELGSWRVLSASILPQSNTGSTTEMDGAAVADADWHHTKAKIEGTAEGELRWWWHSHVNMSVFWSGTDEEAIAQLGDAGYVVSTVFNLKGEMLSSFYQNVPHPTWLPEIPTRLEQVELEVDLAYIIELAAEIGFTPTMKKEELQKMVGGCFELAPTEAEKEEWQEEYDKACPPRLPYSASTYLGYTSYSAYLDSLSDYTLPGWSHADTRELDIYKNDNDLIDDIYETLESFPMMGYEQLQDCYDDIDRDRLLTIVCSDTGLSQLFFPNTYKKKGAK